MSRRFFGKVRSLELQPNTFIGGVASTINTAALLAAKLSITESYIKGFQISGNNIACSIKTDYDILEEAFNDISFDVYYIDLEHYCKNVESSVFLRRNISAAVFEAAQITGAIAFQSGVNGSPGHIDILSIPSSVPIGATSGNEQNLAFTDLYNLYVNIANETNRGGSRDGDLDSTGLTLNNLKYSSNTTKPVNVSNLTRASYSGSSLKLSFTQPSSFNNIDFYLVFIGINYIGKLRPNEPYIVGLELNTLYSDIKVIALDEMGNISGFSNSISATTNSSYVVDTSNIASMWQFEDDVLDSVGSNNGTATAITYATGLVGKCGVFNGSNSRVNTNSNLLSGATSFTVSMLFKVNTLGKTNVLYGCWDTTSSKQRIIIRLNSANTLQVITKTVNGQVNADFSKITDNNWHSLICTYNGTYVSLFIDGKRELLEKPQTGAMASSSDFEYIGDDSRNFSFDGNIDEVAINNTEAINSADAYDLAMSQLNGVNILI